VQRRSIFVALVVATAASLPATASAATAPSAPQLTSAPYVSPAVFTWTPGADMLNISQTVYRSRGACATPLATGQAVAVYLGNTRTTHNAVPGDGTWCFYVSAADALGGTAASPGITLTIDTTPPISTVEVSDQVAGVVHGTVNINRSASDATSGVVAQQRYVGAVGHCPDGTGVGMRWDTTTFTDGTYDVCNVVTDAAGLVMIATVTVTVTNAAPAPAPMPSPIEPAGAAPTPPAAAAPAAAAPAVSATGDKVAPHAPTKLAILKARARKAMGLVPLTLHWVNPTADDLERVVVVLNARRQPRDRTDGTLVYSGLRTSTAFKLRAGANGYLALFAVDRSGNVSKPARHTVSLASLIPLRPLTGSKVVAAPRLTWKATEGTVYYNVQVFLNGKRILTDWPAQASFQLPPAVLEPGTYTWFVWPALKGKGSTATFGDLIGRATFLYEG
jgi:hypothetical protein